MMNDMNIETELKENLSQGLIKRYSLCKNSNGSLDGFLIELLEESTVSFEIGENYCYVDKQSKAVYESFEAILQALSPLYSTKFNELLFQKMSQLEDAHP